MDVRKLRAAMIMSGYDQRRLASEIGITPTSLSRKMLGKSKFNIDQIISICRILGITDGADKADIFLSRVS